MELGNIISYKKGKAPSGVKLKGDLVTYLSPEYLRNKSKEVLIPDFFGKVEVESGDLLLLWDGSNAGEFFLGKNGVLSSTMVKLVFDENKNDRLFLYYQLKFIEYFLKSQTNGSGIPHVDKEVLLSINVENFEFTEQTQIATILSKVDEAITQTEQLISKYTRIKTGLMQDLLTKGIDEHGNIRSEATHEFKDSPLGRIPQEWEVKRLSELSLKIGDGTHSSVRFSENNEVPFLFVSCIRPNKIDWTKKTSINLDEYMKISRGKEPKKGTVLYSLVGSYGNAVTLDSAIKLSFQRHIGFIETKRNELVPDFLTLFLNSIYGNIQADDLAVGNAQKTITLGALNQFQILKPSFKEQKLIVEKNKFIQIHLTEIETQLSKLQSLKTGLMQDLLTGKVRVNSAEVKEANETGLV
jgi:type I restriction enzyme S subunit